VSSDTLNFTVTYLFTHSQR